MTDQQQPTPLWEVMHRAYEDECLFSVPVGYAAEIEALAQWLVPEEPEPPSVRFHSEVGFYSDRDWQRWHVRQQIRQRLLDEALRAREGQP